MHIIHVYADTASEWNCSQWRSLTPSDAINASGRKDFSQKLIHASGFIDFLNPAVQNLVGDANLIIFQRNVITEDAINAMYYWQGLGKPVAIDLDDAYHILPWSNPAHKFWQERKDIDALRVLEKGLSISNGLIAPNRLLLSDWAHVAQGFYLQNYAETKWWIDLPSKESLKEKFNLPKDKIIIGWGGSVSHYDSWWGSGLREAAEKISLRHPEVIWMICGNDMRIYNQLPVSNSQKIHQPGVPPSEWPKVVKTFDIGVAPLFGPYDQRRSWIKGMEYMLAGVPWIGTIGEPYRDIAEFGMLIKNGILEWESAIENAITNLKQLTEKSIEKIEFSQNRFLASNAINIFWDVYNGIQSNTQIKNGSLPGVAYVTAQ